MASTLYTTPDEGESCGAEERLTTSESNKSPFSFSPDGQRFLMPKPKEQQQTALTQINVVQNWFEKLQRRVPTGK
jgi:hypothetical protein